RRKLATAWLNASVVRCVCVSVPAVTVYVMVFISSVGTPVLCTQVQKADRECKRGSADFVEQDEDAAGGGVATIAAVVATEVEGRHDQSGTARSAALSDGPEPHTAGSGGGRPGLSALPSEVSGARGHSL